MANNSLDFMKDVMGAPFGDLISSVGQGVASAQAALDAASVAQTLALYSEGGDEMVQRLRDIGYMPTFYTIPETEVEAQVSLSFSVQETSTGSSTSPAIPNSFTQVGKAKVYATPMNAGITNRFNLNVAASAKIKFKIVPVPPPGNANEMRVVPDVVGKTLVEAEDLLAQFNLIKEISEGPDNGVVKEQDPTPGTVVSTSDAILLKMQPKMPNLINMYKADAIALLTASKITPVVSGSGTPYEIVTAQSVTAGTLMEIDDPVTITIGSTSTPPPTS